MAAIPSPGRKSHPPRVSSPRTNGAGDNRGALNRFGRSDASAERLERLLTVLVTVCRRLHHRKGYLAVGRHVIRRQAQAQRCVAARHPPNNFAEWLPRFAPTTHAGCCLHGRRAPGSIPRWSCAARPTHRVPSRDRRCAPAHFSATNASASTSRSISLSRRVRTRSR